MDKFKIDTTFQFPFFKLNELVSYSEVKKPSGVQYMLLVLINESKSKTSTMKTILNNFGVPDSLFSVFSAAANDLINNEILEFSSFGSAEYFADYKIRQFRFTEKGKKVFKEESILTGKTKEAKIPLFYDIAMNQLALSMPADLDPKPLMDSAITPEFMDQFECRRNEEDFINMKKGVRIPIYENGRVVKNEIIKSEEIITSVERLNSENWVGKYDCDIAIDNDNISFEFEDKVLKNFFEEHYSAEMINKFISYKNKFSFSKPVENKVKLSDFKDKNVISVIKPVDLNDVLKQKGKLMVTKGLFESSSVYTIKDEQGLENFDKACEFILVDQSDSKYGFIPGIYKFNSEKFGDIYIPLVLKVGVDGEDFKKILVPYIDGLSGYSEDNLRELIKITGISKDYQKAYEMMEKYFSGNPENNLVLLNESKQLVMQNQNILTKYKEILKKNFDLYITSVSEDNLETFLKITNGIPKFLNLNTTDVLSKVFGTIGNINDKKGVYELMVKNGYDRKVIALYSNPVEQALDDGDAEDGALQSLINFDSTLNELKNLSKIQDILNYTFDVENLDTSSFKKNYTTAYSLYKNIKFFEENNKDRFKNYDSFMSVFGLINDDINMTEAALKNSNNIKPELIEKKIVSGEYQFVFVNISAKLETILKTKYQLEGTLSDMLSQARKEGKIDRNIVSDLHDFRENRNAFVHAEDRTASFNADDLRRWAKEVFELEVDEK